MENTSLESLAELPLLWQSHCVQTLHSAWFHVLFQKQLNVLQCQFLCVLTEELCAAIPSQLSADLAAPAQPLQCHQGAELPSPGIAANSWKSRQAGSPELSVTLQAGSHTVERRETSSSSAEGIKNIMKAIKQVLLPVLTDLCVWQGQKFRVWSYIG